jgi:short-subunit dehydrogenase
MSRMRKTILITGASSRLGRGMASEFAQRGRDPALCARRLDRLEELRAALAVGTAGLRAASSAAAAYCKNELNES